jgi:hypothetical protein
MAGLKSPSRKKRDASKPGTVLIVFLVFFILLSIGLGVWGYYGYAEQDKLRNETKNAKISEKAKDDFAKFNQYLAYQSLAAIGGAGNPKDVVIDQTDLEPFNNVRAEVLRDNGLYQKERTLEKFKQHLGAFKTDLGDFDEKASKYPTTYREKTIALAAELQEKKTLLSTKEDELKALTAKFQDLQNKTEEKWTAALAEIKKGNNESLKAAQDKTKEMANQFELNRQLNLKIEDTNKEHEQQLADLTRQLNVLKAQLLKSSADKTDVVAGLANTGIPGGQGQLHALLLDISRGRPLWDAPLGKIVRVDLPARQVYINLGSANGMQPETIFNVFGTGPDGRADRQLKATVEIIRVLDANSSVARITSLYDTSGQEINLSDTRLGRLGREADNALKEGDLLFNTFWGSRVAIAGNIRFAGQASDNPAEQMRILDSFRYFLGRNGIVVDAYLDLNDGQIKGAITNRTRYLIRGDDLIDPAQIGMVKKEAKPADGDDKDAPKEAAAPPDRLKVINDAAAKMRREAADKGLFVISTDNFLNVIGYRQTRNAGFAEPSGFHPSPVTAGRVDQAPAAQIAPVPEATPAPNQVAPAPKAPDVAQ